MNSAEWSDRSGQSHTFAFADLAGFTALTEAHGDEQAADLAGEFSRTAAAVTLGLALTSELMAEHGYPAIRVGMHTGPAVERSGDWFGAAVNLAARISSLAAGNEVLLSQATMAQAGEVDGVRFDERGQQRLRNVSEPTAPPIGGGKSASNTNGSPLGTGMVARNCGWPSWSCHSPSKLTRCLSVPGSSSALARFAPELRC